MELDLDAFLQSHNTTDEEEEADDDGDDEDLHSLHHRTVDELLLNDSSSSSSSPSSPSSLNHRSYLRGPRISPQEQTPSRNGNGNYDDVSVGSPKTLPVYETPVVNYSETQTLRLSHSQSLDKPGDSKFSSITRLKSGEFSGDPFSLGRNVLRPLPTLFGVVRPNAKPGAALAAAVAAARSIPTPHAAAIKSRRAGTATLQKVLDPGELVQGPKAGVEDSEVVSEIGAEFEGLGVSSGAGSEISQPGQGGKLFEDDGKLDSFQSAEIEVGVELSSLDGIGESSSEASEVAHVSKVDEIKFENLGEISSGSNVKPHITSPIPNLEEGPNLDENCTVSFSNDGNDKRVTSSSADDNTDVGSVLIAPEESAEEGIPSSPGSDKGRKLEGTSILAVSETHDLENVIPLPKDGEGSLGEDDTSTQNDVTELVQDLILQWESKRGSRRSGKKSRSSMKPLELAEELEKKHSFTGLHWEEGAAAQPMRLEGVRRGSTVLGYFDNDANNTITRTISSQAFRRDHGSPQALAVHLNFIAVGMSKGVIVVVPSKYSPHHADNMDAKMLMLGLQGDRSHAPVTSMCFNQQGDLLFAGYGDGHYTVWDVQKASAVKVISEHKAPVVHMLYLGQDSQASRQFNVVSGDSKGVVKLIRFSVVPWLNRFSTSKPLTLLDESTSTVVCASPLLSDECYGGSLISSQGSATVSTSGIGSMMGGVVGGDWKLFEGSSLVEEGVVIFVTHQSALVV